MFGLNKNYFEMKALLKKGNDCEPHEKRRFYDLKINLLQVKRDEYEFWPEERAKLERKRIGAIKGLAMTLDEVRDSFAD